jgi:hypothetical protein
LGILLLGGVLCGTLLLLLLIPLQPSAIQEEITAFRRASGSRRTPLLDDLRGVPALAGRPRAARRRQVDFRRRDSTTKDS